MRIIPVVDVMTGTVVRAIGGDRGRYRPLESRIVTSVEPAQVARAMIQATGSTSLYVADLDAIGGGKPTLTLVQQLHEVVPDVWVDSGVQTEAAVGELMQAGAGVVILGSETTPSLELIDSCCREFGPTWLAFSVDLRDGSLFGEVSRWSPPPASVLDLVSEVREAGIRRVILLDLVRVGGRAGPSTIDLCRELLATLPDLMLFDGGGIRGRDDIQRLTEAWAVGVLVSTAIHDGLIP
jgi:phosphoribosylformimino-5-aminoimidazole carboxamide ribotide isomerase